MEPDDVAKTLIEIKESNTKNKEIYIGYETLDTLLGYNKDWCDMSVPSFLKEIEPRCSDTYSRKSEGLKNFIKSRLPKLAAYCADKVTSVLDNLMHGFHPEAMKLFDKIVDHPSEKFTLLGSKKKSTDVIASELNKKNAHMWGLCKNLLETFYTFTKGPILVELLKWLTTEEKLEEMKEFMQPTTADNLPEVIEITRKLLKVNDVCSFVVARYVPSHIIDRRLEDFIRQNGEG